MSGGERPRPQTKRLKTMNAVEFKKQAKVISYKLAIEYKAKRAMLPELTDEAGSVVIPEGETLSVHAGDEFYMDDEITPEILKKADFIARGNEGGYSFYISRGMDGDALEAAFMSTVGWHIECALEEEELFKVNGRIIGYPVEK